MRIKVGLFVRFLHFVSDARLHKGCARERAIVIEHTHSFFLNFFYRECLRGIGEDLLIEAYNIINTQEEDYVEVSFTSCHFVHCLYHASYVFQLVSCNPSMAIFKVSLIELRYLCIC